MARPASSLGPIGLILPTFPQARHPESAPNAGPTTPELVELSRAAEGLGADALWACDHLFWHGPTVECLTALTVAAGATTTAAVGSCVLQLPLRRPTVVAKQVASLQTLSEGRFVLGVGVGSHPGEYESAGVDYHRRGRALDEGIETLRRQWAADADPAVGADGRPTYRQLPPPPPVPVWIGGSSAPARRRAARSGDGWMPLFLSPDRYRQEVALLADDVVAAGRPPGSVTPAMVLFVSVDDDPTAALRRGTRWMSSMYALPPKAFERHLVSGRAQEVADVVAAFRASGARHVVLYVTDDQPLAQFAELAAALGATAVPRVSVPS